LVRGALVLKVADPLDIADPSMIADPLDIADPRMISDPLVAGMVIGDPSLGCFGRAARYRRPESQSPS
jgi:hypothetical protein